MFLRTSKCTYNSDAEYSVSKYIYAIALFEILTRPTENEPCPHKEILQNDLGAQNDNKDGIEIPIDTLQTEQNHISRFPSLKI